MGAYYQFRCKHCGYEVMTSGGKDRGISVSIQTMVCRDCKKLVDVNVGKYKQDRETGKEMFVPEAGCCPSCKNTNLDEWGKEMSCPKCEGFMDKGEMTAIWD